MPEICFFTQDRIKNWNTNILASNRGMFVCFHNNLKCDLIGKRIYKILSNILQISLFYYVLHINIFAIKSVIFYTSLTIYTY